MKARTLKVSSQCRDKNFTPGKEYKSFITKNVNGKRVEIVIDDAGLERIVDHVTHVFRDDIAPPAPEAPNLVKERVPLRLNDVSMSLFIIKNGVKWPVNEVKYYKFTKTYTGEVGNEVMKFVYSPSKDKFVSDDGFYLMHEIMVEPVSDDRWMVVVRNGSGESAVLYGKLHDTKEEAQRVASDYGYGCLIRKISLKK